MRKLSPTSAARHLESLLLCTQLARQHSQDVVVATLAEVNRGSDPSLPEINWRTSERVSAQYVRNKADLSWRKKFNEVLETLDVPLPHDFCEHLDGGVQTVIQYGDGMITFQEFVFWVIDALAKHAGPEAREALGIRAREVSEYLLGPATSKPSVRSGVEL